MNVKLLRKVQRAILKHPDQFEMEFYFTRNLKMPHFTLRPAGGCGTAGCIAGWAIHLKRNKPTLEVTSNSVKRDDADWYRTSPPEFRIAKRLLGLKQDEANRLFYRAHWPNRFDFPYTDAFRPATRAKVASRRIDHFIKTKGAE